MVENVQKVLRIELQANEAIQGLQQLNAKIEENRARMKELANANQKGSEEYAKLEQHTKTLTRTKQALSKETQNEIKLEYEQKGSINALQAELSKLTQKYNALSEAERKNGVEGKRLSKQINEVTNELNAAEQGIQKYYRNVGNYQNAIMNAIGVNGRFGQSIMNITNITASSTTNITQAFSSMGTSVKAFGASLMALMSNPVFLAIAGIAGVGMAFKWFYDYNEGLAEASRLTEQFTGLQGEQMQGFRDKVMATADVMGKDFKETLQAANTLMANFHIDGEQAMDAINKGFAAGADVNGDMLQKLKQYAPTFHDAGIEAEQMVAIISQTKSGIFTDQGLEAIKQGSTRIREMSSATKQSLESIGIDVNAMQAKLRDGTMTTFDALQEVSAQLKTMPNDAQEVGNVMADVFGRQGKFASQEMIEGLADMSTSLDDVAAQTGEYGELLLENIDTEEELNNVTAALFDMTDNGWENIKQQATIFAKKALVAVVKGLVDVANWFIKLYNSSLPVRAAVNMIATQFKVLWSVVKFAFNNIINGFKTIGRGISAVVNGFSQAGNAIKAFGQGVALIFKGISKMSWEMIEQGWNTISGGMKRAAISAFDGLKEVVTSGAADWADAAGKFGNEVGNAVMDGIKNTMNDQWNEIKIPAYAGGGGGADTGGGGGGNNSNSSSNGGGAGSRNRGGGSRNRGGSNRTSRNSGGNRRNTSSTTRKTGKTPEQKAEEDAQRKMKELIEEANRARMKALEEEAKTSKDAVDKLAEMQKQAIISKYGTLEDLDKRLSNAQTDEQRKQAETAIEGYNHLMQNVEDNRKKMYEDIDKAAEEREKALAQKLAQIYLETSKEGSQSQLTWQKELLDQEEEQELAAVKDSEELKNAIILKYQQKREQLEKDFAEKRKQAEKERMLQEVSAQQAYAEAMLASTEEWQEQNLQYQLQVLHAQMVAELAMYEDNEVMKAAIRDKYAQMETQARRDHAQTIAQIEKDKYDAISGMIGGFGEILGKFGEDQKEFAILQKTLAFGEIMIAQAVAIANAIKQASQGSINVWQMIAQIATGVTAVTVSMIEAFKSLDAAKFATGGYISGAGTSTSDSIPVRVSNGESIMNANTTAMFGGLLSSLNQLGGGVPIQVQETASSVRGEDMLARAVARGVAMLPNPVVSVEDINRGQRQVEVMNERATL